jgi:acyl transferase domain-containing protein
MKRWARLSQYRRKCREVQMPHPSERDPVAITGIGCRLPGASNPTDFWNMLRDGVDAVGTYPGGRFSFIDRVYAGLDPAGQPATRDGGFLRDLDKFDPEFFGISPREAPFIDPAQRLLFEVAWEAIEDAGLVREQIAGTKTGVFAGLWTNDYEICLREDPAQTDFYSTLGTGRYALSGRISYFFDLRGPSLTIDTACSSSLVAIHIACRSLWSGESQLALAGGANVILRPDITLAYSRAGMLSPHGRCRFGDISADGYVRSEGAAIIVLKPLSRALADGDRVYAVIRGSAVNCDGQSSPLLVSPSRIGQAELIAAALKDAGVAASSVDYIEAHGTGTPAGDPVELDAISRALSPRDEKVLVGSVKTNIGHTEAAAGVAAVAKVALALHNGTIPKSLHFASPSPQIDWERVEMSVESAPWRHGIAGVSGFGITGTNAHVVLQAATAPNGKRAADPPRHLITLSAHTAAAVREHASAWQGFLSGAESLTDIAYTATRRRTHGEYRLAVAAANAAEMAEKLGAWAGGEEVEGLVAGRVLGVTQWKTAFVFSGAGGQWLGMGQSLFESEPVFRDAIEACDAALRRQGGPALIDEIFATPQTSRLAEFEVLQPMIWAVQLALVELWKSWGVAPDGVVGHSMGEVTAAVAGGAISLDDGAAVICLRSRLSSQIAGRGLMAVASAPVQVVEEILATFEGRVAVAGVNGATSLILSGDADAVEAAIEEFNRRELFCRRVNVNLASHSFHMDEVRPKLEAALAGLLPEVPSVPVYSTVSGEQEQVLDAAYWGKNLRHPVLFWPALRRMIADGYNAFIEISPHPVLLHSIQETIREQGAEATAVVCMRRGSDECTANRVATGSLYTAGYPINFASFYPEGRCVSLPSYPWQRERHWPQINDSSAAQSVNNPADDLYEMRWQDTEPAPPASHGMRRFALLAHDSTGETLARELRAAGHEAFCVASPDELAVISPMTDVVHLLSMHPEAEATSEFESVARAQRYGADSLLDTLRAMEGGEPPRLWVVTSNALPVRTPADRLRIEHAPMAGLASAIRREHPELQCRHIDISGQDAEAMPGLTTVLLSATKEDVTAIRGSLLSSPRFGRASGPLVAAQFSGEATYLIAGGLGGVGLAIAASMVQNGARHLVLSGRRAEPGDEAGRLEDIRAAGAEVRYVQANLTDENSTRRLLDQIAGTMPPLKGIFLATAVLDDALLMDTTPERFAPVFASKAAPALNLHRLTASLSLDFFALCSSVAVSMTQPGQGSYAAANAFLDCFAAYRRAMGLPAVSVQWGVWDQMGLANAAGTRRSTTDYINRGVSPLNSAAGVAMFRLVLSAESPVLLASPVAWDRFATSYEGQCPRVFSSLMPQAAEKREAPATKLRERLNVLKPEARKQAVQEHVQEHLAVVLKTSALKIDVRKPLGTLGLDSLLSIDLVRRLSSSTGVKLPATVVFNYPTVTALAAEVARRMNVERVDEPQQSNLMDNSAAVVKPTGDVAELTEEEALLALMASSGASNS